MPIMQISGLAIIRKWVLRTINVAGSEWHIQGILCRWHGQTFISNAWCADDNIKRSIQCALWVMKETLIKCHTRMHTVQDIYDRVKMQYPMGIVQMSYTKHLTQMHVGQLKWIIAYSILVEQMSGIKVIFIWALCEVSAKLNMTYSNACRYMSGFYIIIKCMQCHV